MLFIRLPFIVFLLVTVFHTVVDSYCLAEDSYPYNLFSRKTAYETVRGTARSETTCVPIQIWLLNRHGTRYASTSGLQKMKLGVKLKEKILSNYANKLPPSNKRLCEKDLIALIEWDWDPSIEKSGNNLAAQGWKELKEIAQRYQKKYPNLMSNYSGGQLYFRATDEQRTIKSCLAFVEGLFGSYDNVPIDPPRKIDEDIRPYKKCKAWMQEVYNNDGFRLHEQGIFRNGSDFRNLVNNVSQRLGFQYTLNITDIESMYDLCRYYTAWYPNITSPWCSVFRKYEAFLLEYDTDLKSYFESSYGHEYNAKLGCMPLKNIVETFNKTVQTDKAEVKGLFYFSHDTMVNMLLSAMDYHKDVETLKGSHYEDLLVSRMYRSSFNTPFAANVAAILHKCNQNDYQVQLFLNELPMKIEGCPQGLCSWDYFKNKFAFSKSCNLNFCNSSNSVR